MSTQLKPLYDRVVVQRIPETEVSQGGIFIPDAVRERPLIGKVVAVGGGRRCENGTILRLSVAVGDFVLFQKYAGADVERGYFEHEGDDVTVMREEEILAIVDPSVVTSFGSLVGS